jgi:hypothetical protein
MTDIGGLLQAAIAALGILGFCGLGVTVLLDRAQKTRVAGLRGDVDDLTKRNKLIDEESAKKDKTIADQHDEIVKLRGDVDTLTGYVNGSAGPAKLLSDQLHVLTELVNVLVELLKAHNVTAVEGFATVQTQNSEMLNILGDRRNVPPENIMREVQRAREDGGV